ncbi:hypothetical protein GNI_093660 [Gregarina niphandrodes]|uniref:Uncharacterized protein n=1 Tax=Gregarina niphandrodes TaxID=110365 RepID=A0A023B585_GRENI|nr:hypothetical protein GNI_093660 [Gregarina niphandrodes]EZG58880.1 hypothetical protein GNI_093660 [Gregarina niphandrodes]|eukprot:XP_011130935.1 hypothetical protein GNI_093660 [Gregarina niphandrodes]
MRQVMDALGILTRLLDQLQCVDIRVAKETVHCFDSESFRYLAAKKIHDTALGQLDENRRRIECMAEPMVDTAVEIGCLLRTPEETENLLKAREASPLF